MYFYLEMSQEFYDLSESADLHIPTKNVSKPEG